MDKVKGQKAYWVEEEQEIPPIELNWIYNQGKSTINCVRRSNKKKEKGSMFNKALVTLLVLIVTAIGFMLGYGCGEAEGVLKQQRKAATEWHGEFGLNPDTGKRDFRYYPVKK